MKKISHAKIDEVNTDCLETYGASKLVGQATSVNSR